MKELGPVLTEAGLPAACVGLTIFPAGARLVSACTRHSLICTSRLLVSFLSPRETSYDLLMGEPPFCQGLGGPALPAPDCLREE